MIDPFRGVLTNLPYSTNNPREMWYFENQDPRRAIFWGIKGTESVGLINFENIQKMVRVVSAYPWPNPGPLFSLEWTKKILDRLRKIAHEPTDVSEEDIRTWVTLTLMEKFDAIVRDVNDYMEDQAKADKRRALIRAIAMIALSAAMVVTLPVALSATFGVALTAVKTVDRVKAARALAEASKEFEKTDFEFSQELERVAMLLDEDAARAVLTGGPTLIEKADQIIAPSPPPPPPPTPTESVTPTAKVAVGPNRLTAKVLRKSVGLTWNPGKYVSGYVVKRSYEGKGYKEIGKVVANVTTYADSNVEYDRTYFYTVQGVQSSETAHGGELTGSTNTVKISIPKPKPDYEVVIDGRSAGFAETLEKVTALALEVSVPGDRVQILYRGEPVGLFIRTAGGMVRVPPGKEEAVLSASKDDILRLIDAAQRKAAEEVEKKKEGGFPWGLLLIPVGIAGAVAASK